MSDDEPRDVVHELVAGQFAHVPFDPDDHPPDLEWGIKSIRPDFRTRNGYTWPFPGNWTPECEDKKILDHNLGPCPRMVGDGICVATTFNGAATGGYNAQNLLIVGWRDEDVLGGDEEKHRVKKAYVAAIVDTARWIRKHDLRRADLRRAYLSGAYLSGAYLRRADLRRAYLRRADLSGAYLSGADLSGAYLRRADLRRAYLSGADLSGADLSGAYLSGADLRRAYLRRAYLRRAYLSGASWDSWTRWPSGFDPDEEA